MHRFPAIVAVLVAVYLVAAILSVFPSPLCAGEAREVLNADFEPTAPSNPPAGWTMWGAQRYKIPANYTRDTTQTHTGKGSFRIHHPAGTEGYVVSSPETAIRPSLGKGYTVRFWARSDRPGESLFGWDGYRQIRPFVEASAPGFRTLSVGPEWKEFQFTIHEGWDFFAEECRYLLLTFKAAGRADEPRTLWIDDVLVVEADSPRQGRLVNPATLRYEPLDHRLRPGGRLAITVDTGKRLREAPREVGGVSFHRVAGWAKLPFDRDGRYVLPAELEEAIRQMRLPRTRFYALGDERFGLESAIDKAGELCRRLNIPQATTALEFEIQGATRKLTAEDWARGVRHSLSRGYAFRNWEITNEPYVGHVGAAFATADSFLEHFLAVSQAIRQVHPEARIGMPIYHRSPAWGNYLLKQAAGHYDFVVPHYYSFQNVHRSGFESVVLAANYQKLDEILQVNGLLRHYNPGREVWQDDTEWGMHSRGAHDERPDSACRNANIFGMMHRAVRLIHYLREGMLRGASTWEMFTYLHDPGFGFLAQDAPSRRSMDYWLFYYVNRHVGRWVLDLDGTAPFFQSEGGGRDEPACRGPLTPVVATWSEDPPRLFVIAANGSWTRSVPWNIELRGFAPRRAQAVVLSHSDPDAHPFLERREELVHDVRVTLDGSGAQTTLPPHAVVFVTFEAK